MKFTVSCNFPAMLWKIADIILISIGIVFTCASTSSATESSDEFFRIQLMGIADVLYTELIEKSIEVMDSKSRPRAAFKINGKGDGGINIITVSSDRIRNFILSGKSLDNAIKAAAHTAVAIPPNTIIIGSDFLDEILLSCYNDLLAFTNFISASPQGVDSISDFDPIVLEKYKSLNDYLRFGNVENVLDKGIESLLPNKFGKDIVRTFSKFKLLDYCALSIAAIILHEIAHIEMKEQGEFIKWIRDKLNSQVLSHYRNIEDKADEAAAKEMAVVLQKILKDKSLKGAMFVEAYLSSLRWFAYRESYAIFGDFRGAKIRDFIFDIWHKQCQVNADDEAASQESRQKSRFFDIEFVSSAQMSQYPLFSEVEFIAIKDKYLQRQLNYSHSPGSTRARLFIRALRPILGENFIDKNMDATIKILDAAENNKPSLIAPDYGAGRKTNFNVDPLLKLLGRQNWKILKAVNCAYDSCLIASPSLDITSGFFELFVHSGSIFHIRYVSRPLQDKDLKEEESARIMAQVKVASIWMFSRFFENIPGIEKIAEENGLDTKDKHYSQILASALFAYGSASQNRCGIVSNGMDLGEGLYIDQTMNSYGWRVIQVFIKDRLSAEKQ